MQLENGSGEAFLVETEKYFCCFKALLRRQQQ